MFVKYNTRFNPTTNGDLHLGHVYTALFNERVAHSSGGKFYVRFEDNQSDTLANFDIDQIHAFYHRQVRALEWLGFKVDDYIRQSEMELELKKFVAHHGYWIPEYKYPFSIPLNPVMGDYNPKEGEWFPYVPYMTYCKVIYDELHGINLLIRGDDLRSEFSLYQHFRKQMGLPEIAHYYLPRVYGSNDEIVSKFYGARTILEYKKADWQPSTIIELLERSVLKEPSEGWHLANVKRYPRLVEAFNI